MKYNELNALHSWHDCIPMWQKMSFPNGRGSRVAGFKSRVAGFEKSRVFLKSCEFSIECIYFSVKFIQTNLNRMQRRRF